MWVYCTYIYIFLLLLICLFLYKSSRTELSKKYLRLPSAPEHLEWSGQSGSPEQMEESHVDGKSGVSFAIGSMHGIFTYIWLILMVNVGKHTVRGSFG